MVPVIAIHDFTLSIIYTIIAHDEAIKLRVKVIPPQLLYKDIKTEVHFSCSICLEEFKSEETINLTDCNHVFHSKCIEKWACKNPTCPYCRTHMKNA